MVWSDPGLWMDPIFNILLKHICHSQSLIWSDQITTRIKTVLSGRKKTDRTAKPFRKVKLTVILCKSADTLRETSMITQ